MHLLYLLVTLGLIAFSCLCPTVCVNDLVMWLDSFWDPSSQGLIYVLVAEPECVNEELLVAMAIDLGVMKAKEAAVHSKTTLAGSSSDSISYVRTVFVLRNVRSCRSSLNLLSELLCLWSGDGLVVHMFVVKAPAFVQLPQTSLMGLLNKPRKYKTVSWCFLMPCIVLGILDNLVKWLGGAAQRKVKTLPGHPWRHQRGLFFLAKLWNCIGLRTVL